MSDKKTGGPAFPRRLTQVENSHQFDEAELKAQSGMTLRDYFAAKAMQAMVGNFRVVNHANPERFGDVTTTEPHREMMLDLNIKTGEHEGAAEIAADAYTIADAMLAARKGDK